MRKTTLSIFILCSAFAAGILLRPMHAAASELEERIDGYLQPCLEIGHLSGTMLVAQGDEVRYHRSFGLADRELDVANTTRTRFGVGSREIMKGRAKAYFFDTAGLVNAPPRDISYLIGAGTGGNKCRGGRR